MYAPVGKLCGRRPPPPPERPEVCPGFQNRYERETATRMPKGLRSVDL